MANGKFLIICALILAVGNMVAFDSTEGKSIDIERTDQKIINSIGMEFVYVHPGTFLMGSPRNEPGRKSDEKQHRVTLTNGFYMQRTEVTQGQWKTVMGEAPVYIRVCPDNCPVERVSWHDALRFIQKLNEIEGTHRYRLPTEAEWEYAARAGSKTAFANGKIIALDCGYDSTLDDIGWYCGNSIHYPHDPVAKKKPNAWGLYDMHGSVWEWCTDWYDNYPPGPVTDPMGPYAREERVLRGGGATDESRSCRSANRYSLRPDIRFDTIGFRLVRSR